MTAHAIFYPREPVVLFRDNWGNRWIWNPILETVDVFQPRARKPYRSFMLEGPDKDFHGALRLAMKKCGFAFMPGPKRMWGALEVRARLTN